MRPRPDLAVEESDGELIILDQTGGEVHQLNATAALIWHGLSQGNTVEQVVASLEEQFEVEHEEAVSDVASVVQQFRELRLIED